MPSFLARYHGELDTGWAEELRPVEHAALLLLSHIADEVHAGGDDGLRFRFLAGSGRRYRAHLRVDEHARIVTLSVLMQVPASMPAGRVPALVPHLNARLTSGAFEQLPGETVVAFRATAQIAHESEREAIRRLVGSSALPLELFEAAVRRLAHQPRARAAR